MFIPSIGATGSHWAAAGNRPRLGRCQAGKMGGRGQRAVEPKMPAEEEEKCPGGEGWTTAATATTPTAREESGVKGKETENRSRNTGENAAGS